MQKPISKKIIIGTVLFSLTTPSAEPLLAATVKSLKRTPQQNHYMGDKTQTVVQKPVQSEIELWNAARKMMQDNNFSKDEIGTVEEIIKKDILHGRSTFLKEVLPLLVDFAVRIRETEKLEKQTPSFSGEGTLFSLIAIASAKYKLVEDTYGKTGHMDEIADGLFTSMGKALQNVQGWDKDLRQHMSNYLEETKRVQEGQVSLSADRRLLSPFDMSLLNPPALYYNRILGFWTFFPSIDEFLPVERLFSYTDLSMIKDIPIPDRPYSLSYLSSLTIASVISNVSDVYITNPPEKVKMFTGQFSVLGNYQKINDQATGGFGAGLEARSGATYAAAFASDQDIFGRLLNYDVKTKDFETLVHKLNLGGSYNLGTLDEVLNASFLTGKGVPIGSTILVGRKFEESYEVWSYFKSAKGKMVYVGKKEVQKDEAYNFFGVDVGKVLVEGAGSTYLIVSTVPLTKDMLQAGVSWDAEKKNELFNLMFDPKVKNVLFLNNPKLVLEIWKLNEIVYGGGGVVAGNPGEDYYRINALFGDKSKADLTIWNEKGFLNSAYVKTIEKYQGILEGKYKLPTDILFYMALSDAESYVKKESNQEWAAVLKKDGLKLQSSYNSNTHHLTKITYEKKMYLSVEFSDGMVNAIYSTPLKKDRFSLGLFVPTRIGSVGGVKAVYNLSDGILGYSTDLLFSVAGWIGKEGIKNIPRVNEVAVDDLKETDPVAWNILTGLGINRTAYFLFETGKVSSQQRAAGGIYFTLPALKAAAGTSQGMRLFAAVEQNTGKVFVTTKEADFENIMRLGVNYYQITKKQLLRLDFSAEHIWYRPTGTEEIQPTWRYIGAATQEFPQTKDSPTWGWAASFLATPSTKEFEGKGGVQVTFGADPVEKVMIAIATPFKYAWIGMNWLFDMGWWPSEKPAEKPKKK
jgi:hypothetical protein